MSRDVQMLFVIETRLVQGLSLEILLTLKVVKFLIYLMAKKNYSIHNGTPVNFVSEKVNKK
jgi:hypothetical protein